MEIDVQKVIERRTMRFNSLKSTFPVAKIAATLGWNRTNLYAFINYNMELSNERLYNLSKLIEKPIDWILAYEDNDAIDVTIINNNNPTVRRRAIKHIGEKDYTTLNVRSMDGLLLCQKAMALKNSDIKKVLEYIEYLQFIDNSNSDN